MGGMSKALGYILCEVRGSMEGFSPGNSCEQIMMTSGQYYGNQSLYGTTGIFGKKKKACLPLPKIVQTLKHF